MGKSDSILQIFPLELREVFAQVLKKFSELEEIRMRVNQPVLIKTHKRECFLLNDGSIGESEKQAYFMSEENVHAMMNRICKDSLYAYEDELRQGFLTVSGGHRIGIAGQAVLEENGRVRTIKHISAINIRIAHEIKGVADNVLPHIYQGGKFCNTLILAPPGCGKTTLLRDIIRQVSNGNMYGQGATVGVVDERSEIAGCFMGIPQNDVGMRTDVLDACPKVHGMMMLIRSMTPQVVAIDEVGSTEDMEAILKASACGCKLLATIHGFGIKEVQKKAYMKLLFEEGFFERFIVMEKLDGCPHIKGIYKKEQIECYDC